MTYSANCVFCTHELDHDLEWHQLEITRRYFTMLARIQLLSMPGTPVLANAHIASFRCLN